MLFIRGSLFLEFMKDDHLTKPRINVNTHHAHLLKEFLSGCKNCLPRGNDILLYACVLRQMFGYKNACVWNKSHYHKLDNF